MSSPTYNYRVFTLIELLIIISIIAILAAILLPSLKKAKDRTQSIECASNLKQQGVAIGMYLNDYNNSWWHPLLTDTAGSNVTWHVTVANYTGICDELTNTSFSKKKKLGTLYCPSDTKDPTKLISNYMFSGGGTDADKSGLDYKKIFKIAYPSELMMVMDGNSNRFCINQNSCYRTYANITGRALSTATNIYDEQCARHPGLSINAVYVDAHVETKTRNYMIQQLADQWNSKFFNRYQRW